MTSADLTPDEFMAFLLRETRELSPDARSVYDRYGIPPTRMLHTWDYAGRQVSKPIWVIARAGSRIVGYDEVEEEFATGTVHHDGEVEEWGTYGERLQWTLLRFPNGDRDGGRLGDPQPVA